MFTEKYEELFALCKKYGVKSVTTAGPGLETFEFFEPTQESASAALPLANTKIPTEEEFLYMAAGYNPSEHKDTEVLKNS